MACNPCNHYNYKLCAVLAYTNWELPDSVLGQYLPIKLDLKNDKIEYS